MSYLKDVPTLRGDNYTEWTWLLSVLKSIGLWTLHSQSSR
jgi:hypothetical protein